jgi:hypothetical protein
MRARIGMALGPYWGSIISTLDVIVAISALGAIGGLSALLHAATPYARHAMKWLRCRPLRVGGLVIRHPDCCCGDGSALSRNSA